MRAFRVAAFALVSLCVAASVNRTAAEEVSAELAAVREKVSAMFEMISPEDINPSPIDG